MDLNDEAQIQRVAEQYGRDSLVVILGRLEEARRQAAQSMQGQ